MRDLQTEEFQVPLSGLEVSSRGLRYSSPMLESYNRKEGVLQQVLTPEPIQIKLDSGTDPWVVAIGVGSIISSIVIAAFTYRLQRNQTKATISTLRHHWMVEVRECSSQLIQGLASLIVSIASDKNFKNSPEYYERRELSLRLQIKLNLLLSKESFLSREIVKKSESLIIAIRSMKFGGNRSHHFKDLRQLEDMVKDQLENAWRDVKRDYGMRPEESSD